jgi:excinuclease UvrABC nuclease subunit
MDNLKAIYGIGTVTETKLQNAGYESYEQIASAPVADLSEKVGMTQTTAEQIIESARTLLEFDQVDEAESETEPDVREEEIEDVSPTDVETMEEDDESEETDVDKEQLANQLVKAILQNPDAVQQIAQEVSLELVQVVGKKLRKKLAKKVLTKKRYRKALLSELVKELMNL